MNNYKKLIFNKISSDNNQIDIIKKLTQIDSKLRFKTGGINTPFKKDSGLERKYESPVRYLQQGEIIPETLKKAKENQSNPFARKTPLTAKEIEQLKKYQKKEQQIKEGSRQDKVNKGYIDPKTGLATGKIEPDDTAEMLAEIALTGGLSLGKNVVKKGLQKSSNRSISPSINTGQLTSTNKLTNDERKKITNLLNEAEKKYDKRATSSEFKERLKSLGVSESEINKLYFHHLNSKPTSLINASDKRLLSDKYDYNDVKGFYITKDSGSQYPKEMQNSAFVLDATPTNEILSTANHENSHRLFNTHISPELKPLTNKLDELELQDDIEYYDYFNDPTEKHAFIDELRYEISDDIYNLKKLTPQEIKDKILNTSLSNEVKYFIQSIKSPNKLIELMQTLPAKTALPAAGIGYGIKKQNEQNKKLSFQNGGSLSLNIIPKGVLHKNKNNIPKELGFGGKGIPVVYCNTDGNCEKTAEIESNELILTKDNSTQLDRLIAKHKNGVATLQDIGQFFKQQLMSNTHNNTKEFKHIKGGKIKV